MGKSSHELSLYVDDESNKNEECHVVVWLLVKLTAYMDSSALSIKHKHSPNH